MVKLLDIQEGQWVQYENQIGRIKSWNALYVFVVFKCDNKWEEYKNYTGESCNPQDLTLCKRIREIFEFTNGMVMTVDPEDNQMMPQGRKTPELLALLEAMIDSKTRWNRPMEFKHA